jgi:SAM-dependent methyltransferase
MLKLNLGCHNRPKQGYVNVDKDKYDGVDIVCDVFNLSQWADGSVDEIYASNILEHAPHTKTESVLKEWHRVLKQGGVLCLSVPDFARAVELYQLTGLQPWLINFLWGDQGYDGAFHYVCYDLPYISRILAKCGFIDISRVETLPNSNPIECSNNRSTLDGKLVSLNIIAVKG